MDPKRGDLATWTMPGCPEMEISQTWWSEATATPTSHPRPGFLQISRVRTSPRFKATSSAKSLASLFLHPALEQAIVSSVELLPGGRPIRPAVESVVVFPDCAVKLCAVEAGCWCTFSVIIRRPIASIFVFVFALRGLLSFGPVESAVAFTSPDFQVPSNIVSLRCKELSSSISNLQFQVAFVVPPVRRLPRSGALVLTACVINLVAVEGARACSAGLCRQSGGGGGCSCVHCDYWPSDCSIILSNVRDLLFLVGFFIRLVAEGQGCSVHKGISTWIASTDSFLHSEMYQNENNERPQRYARDFHHALAESLADTHPNLHLQIPARKKCADEDQEAQQPRTKFRKLFELIDRCEEEMRKQNATMLAKNMNKIKNTTRTEGPGHALGEGSSSVEYGRARGRVQGRVQARRIQPGVQARRVQAEASSCANGGDHGRLQVSPDRIGKRPAEDAPTGNPSRPPHGIPCPLCASTATKFRYYNNKDVNQPRYLCHNCTQMWTHGGTRYHKAPVAAGRKRGRSQTPPVPVATARTHQGPPEILAAGRKTKRASFQGWGAAVAMAKAQGVRVSECGRGPGAREAHDEAYNPLDHIKHEPLPVWGHKQERSFKYQLKKPKF